jgi:CheY-like chemotaxis protein
VTVPVGAVTAGASGAAPVPALGPARLLLIAPPRQARSTIAELARRWDIDVVEASSIDDAIASLAHGTVMDAVLLDTALVDDGADALPRLRALRPSLAIVPMVSVRGHAVPIKGAVGRVTKPVKAARLHAALRDALTRAGAAGGGSALPVATPAAAARSWAAAGLRVLVAEDNPVNQLVIRRMLEKLGTRPDLVADGAEAVAAVARVRYDLVLMDLQMPVMGGLEATRRIRAHGTAHAAPAITALTADVAAEVRQECADAGMDGYLSKPLTLDALIAAIAPRRERRRQGRPARLSSPWRLVYRPPEPRPVRKGRAS